MGYLTDGWPMAFRELVWATFIAFCVWVVHLNGCFAIGSPPAAATG